MNKIELSRFKAKGDWNKIGKIVEYEFIVERFEVPNSTGIMVTILNNKGEKINNVSFNPFSNGCEISTNKSNTVFFSNDNESSSKSSYINSSDLERLQESKNKLNTIKQAIGILFEGED